MTPVGIESPLGADTDEGFARNLRYARWCCRDAVINYGEAPYASHLMMTQFLDDRIAVERELGMKAGEVFYGAVHRRVLYVDLCPVVVDGDAERAVRMHDPYSHRQLSRGMYAAYLKELDNWTGRQPVFRTLPKDMLDAFNRGEEPPRT